MNAQEYIASGLLEAYVLGALPDADAAGVASAMVQYPEVAAEVVAIEEALLNFDRETAIEPPAHLQDQIWNALSANAAAGYVQEKTLQQDVPKVIPFAPQPQVQRWSMARAAVWAALIASALLNIFLWYGRKNARQDTFAMKQRLDTANEGQRALALALSKFQHEVNMMANPDMQPVVMKTTQKDHPMVAIIYYNKDGTDAYISLQKLPEAPKGMQYQLWAIADGKPVDLGVIRNEMVQQQGIEKVNKAVPSGQAFAISLEKEGGSPVPTMDRIYVMGKTTL